MLPVGTAAKEGRNRMNEYEVERDELLYIINECIDNANNQDLRTILDCLNEIGFDVTRPTRPIDKGGIK